MSFGATFEDGETAAPDDNEAPQVASSGAYLAQQRKLVFEKAWAAHEAGDIAPLSYALAEEILRDVAQDALVVTEDQRAWLAAEVLQAQGGDDEGRGSFFPPPFAFPRQSRRQPERDPRLDAYAANQAHAAARAAHPSIGEMNVVITLRDAARVFAYRGLHALAARLKTLADRVTPDR